MWLTLKPKAEIFVRLILAVVVLLNVLIPTVALALPSDTEETVALQTEKVSNPLPVSEAVYYQPSDLLPSPNRFSPDADEQEPEKPGKDLVEFNISANKGEIESSRTVTINVVIRNNSEVPISNLNYYDKLEKGLEFGSSNDKAVKYNFSTNKITYKVESLNAGGEVVFSYTLNVKNKKAGKLSIHNAEIEYNINNEMYAQNASLGFADTSSVVNSDSLIVVPDQSGDGWGSAGRYSLYLGEEVLSQEAVVLITPADITGNGPDLQFDLELIQTTVPVTMPGGDLNEQDISLNKIVETDFDTPAYLEINLDGIIDLENIPAGHEPYVATYDEKNKIWVKIPIVDQNEETNSITVEASHFSTWGVGLGNSLPQNGANVLLFDQPYTSLFTGAVNYSIPIWTPPGRAGMAPDISLSYSSATVDGVLGDVQAPWVGMGWNIDSAEIVRKITTSETGYGYENDFTLTINGTSYELMVDPNEPSRYYTRRGSFLYIERHNPSLGNVGDENEIPNVTKEWWELKTTDGTSYRFGWNDNSEQLALMYGYSCLNIAACPDGAYASSGYAGNAVDRVALRWRVDYVLDTNGNFMEYTYHEEKTTVNSATPQFDRASYLESIAYTGNLVQSMDAKYIVQFIRENRIGDGRPADFNLWDNFDTQYLKEIRVCYETCPAGQSRDNLIRSYILGYQIENVPTGSNGTLILESLKSSGGGFSDGVDETGVVNNINIPVTESASVKFTYENKPNRAVSGNAKDYKYPRLTKIENGYGGAIEYIYENDNRGVSSWYNYRVKNTNAIASGSTVGAQGYVYTTPVYAYSNNTGNLIGYTNTTEIVYDFNGVTKLSETSHQFGTSGLDIGNEIWTEVKNATGTVLRKNINTYVTDNSEAPFVGWNYRYLSQVQGYIRTGTSLLLTSKTIYVNDPGNGNLLLKQDYLGGSIYRKEAFEYSTMPALSASYVLDRPVRRTLMSANNTILSEAYYEYSPKGNIVLLKNVLYAGQNTNTSDAAYSYDGYGNVKEMKVCQEYGTMSTPASGSCMVTTTSYDAESQTFPLSVMTPLGVTKAKYLIKLGVPYESTDVNSWTTITNYDGLGRTLSVIPPGLPVAGIRYTYPAIVNGNVAAPYEIKMEIYDETIGNYRSVIGVYDGLSRLLQTKILDGNSALVTETSYNAQGLVSQQSLPHSINDAVQYTTSTYDSMGRPLVVTAPGNITTTTLYDGLKTIITDPNGNKTVQVSDGLGRLSYVQEFNGNNLYSTTQYTYDGADRLRKVIDGQFNVTEIVYDTLGRKISMDDPDMGKWTYAYNALGQIISQTDARGTIIQFEYDSLNRLLVKKDNGLLNVVFGYGTANIPGSDTNDTGMRVSMITNAENKSSWEYDNYGRTVKEKKIIGGVLQTMITEVDWLGRPLRVTYPDGEVLAYAYDALGRPESVASSLEAGNLVELAYNSLSQITQVGLDNGVIITNQYDTTTNRLQSRSAENNSSLLLMSFSYEYDLSGNIKKIQDDVFGETHSYAYDSLNRLTSAEAVKGSNYPYRFTYDYDKVGNILAQHEWQTSDVLLKDDFENSPSDDWSLVEDDGADLWSVPGSLLPTALGEYSLIVDVNDDNPIYLFGDLSISEPRFRSRFYFNPNSLVLAPGEVLALLIGLTSINNVDQPSFKLELQKTGANYQIRANAINNAGVWTQSAWQTISSTRWSALEFDYQTLANGGSTTLWINGENPQTISSIDNDIRLISSFKLGAMDVDTGTRGQMLLDAFEARVNTYIGLLTQQNAAADSTTLLPMTYSHQPIMAVFPASYYLQEADTPTPTVTSTPSETSIPSETPIPSSTPAPTLTYTPSTTSTSTRTLIPTITNTPTITYTPSRTPTKTTTPTKTPTASKTPTQSNTPTSTKTPTPTRTSTPITNTSTSTATPIGGSNLVAYWNFNEQTGTLALDQISTVANGTITGAERVEGFNPLGSNTLGALRFTSAQTYVSITNAPKLQPALGFSLAAWVFPTQVNTGTEYNIILKDTSTYQNYRLYINANGYIVFKVNDLVPNEVRGPKISVNQWTHVTAVYDYSAQLIKLYINGNLVASKAVTGTIIYSSGVLTFSNSTNPFIGMLDEVQLYSGTLSESGINGLLTATPASTAIFTLTPVHTSTHTLTSTKTPTPSKTFTPSRTSTPLTFTPTASKTLTPTMTLTPSNTATSTGVVPVTFWGTGHDGDLVVPTPASGVTGSFNINTNHTGNRTCADAAAYNVTALGNTAATLNVGSGDMAVMECLQPGDEVLLINLQGTTAYYENTGLYEFLRVESINGSIVYFTDPKVNWYGSGFRSDSNIGIGSGQQRVMLMRVPNYASVRVDGKLTANAWDGNRFGVLVFRVNGELSGSGSITVDKLGYRGGETYAGITGGYGAGGRGDVGRNGGGGGYGTSGGSSYTGLAGIAYGDPALQKIFHGSGGGSSGGQNVQETCGNPSGMQYTCTVWRPGPIGGTGGGILMFSSQTINFSGTMTSKGGNGMVTAGIGSFGGGGSGGAIRVEGAVINPISLTANGGAAGGSGAGAGGVGRVAVYYEATIPSSVASTATAYVAMIGEVATPTAVPTSTPIGQVNAWGTGNDGTLTINSGVTFNLNTQNSNTRSCTDGGDGVSYSVIQLDDSWAKLSIAPSAGCLNVGDEIILINLAGASANFSNTGTYEFLRVGSVVGDIVYFVSAKTKSYGANTGDDTNIGTAITQQHVVVQRVPNYSSVEVNGTLTISAFSSYKNGVLAFRVLNELTGSGTITANAMGGGLCTYDGCGKAAAISSRGGGGGGYQNSGVTGTGYGGPGGAAFGSAELDKIYFGGYGGRGGTWTDETGGTVGGWVGGVGGGIIWLSSNTINFSGSITAKGADALNNSQSNFDGGGGAGGAIRIEGENFIALNTVNVDGGAFDADGSKGRIAVYYHSEIPPTLGFAPDYLQKRDMPDSLFSYDFETGNLTGNPTEVPGWSSVANSPVVNGFADYTGNYGMQVQITSTAEVSAVYSTAQNESSYRARFYVNPNSISMGGDTLDVFSGYNGTTRVFTVQLQKTASTYQVRAGAYNDAGTWIYTNWYDIQNTWTGVEVNYHALLTSGSFELIVGDVSRQVLTNIDNDTRVLNEVRLGAQGIGANTSGTLYFDDFISRRFTAIGLLPDPGGAVIVPSNQAGWVEKQYTYSTTIPHAVTSLVDDGNETLGAYTYDANGNMTCRVEDGVTYKQVYNTENRISSIMKLLSGSCEDANPPLVTKWDFAYDGDGTRTVTLTTPYDATGLIPQTASLTSYYFGGAYETRSDGAIFKYYSFGGQSIVNEKSAATNNQWQISYLLTDHLGSIVAVTDASGTLISQQRYLPFGGKRTAADSISQTDFGYTGQRDLESMGLMDYKFRTYSPYLNQFTQPDTIVPDPYNPQDWNRYAYARNNPVKYTDPTGHMQEDFTNENMTCKNKEMCTSNGEIYMRSARPHASTRPIRSQQGIIYTSITVLSNADLSGINLSTKAEQSYDGWSGSGAAGMPYGIKAAGLVFGLPSDFAIEELPSYTISLEISWEKSWYGVSINTIQLNNNAPGFVEIDSVVLDESSPRLYSPRSLQALGPDIVIGNNESLNMDINSVMPSANDIMTVRLNTAGFPVPNPYIRINISPSNLRSGCSFPTIIGKE